MRIKIPNYKNEYVEYELDTEKALEAGILREVVLYPLENGDVYTRKGWGELLLIKPDYRCRSVNYLVGRNGLEPYSNYDSMLSDQQVEERLNKEGYRFSHNINKKVEQLIKNPKITILT